MAADCQGGRRSSGHSKRNTQHGASTLRSHCCQPAHPVWPRAPPLTPPAWTAQPRGQQPDLTAALPHLPEFQKGVVTQRKQVWPLWHHTTHLDLFIARLHNQLEERRPGMAVLCCSRTGPAPPPSSFQSSCSLGTRGPPGSSSRVGGLAPPKEKLSHSTGSLCAMQVGTWVKEGLSHQGNTETQRQALTERKLSHLTSEPFVSW